MFENGLYSILMIDVSLLAVTTEMYLQFNYDEIQ